MQADDCAVVLGRDLDIVDHVAPVHGVHQVLLPALDPLDRAARHHGHVGHDEIFGQDIQLGAEAAAHVRRDHAHVIFGDAEHLGYVVLGEVGRLSARPDGQLVHRLVVLGDDAARLDGDGGEPLVD